MKEVSLSYIKSPVIILPSGKLYTPSLGLLVTAVDRSSDKAIFAYVCGEPALCPSPALTFLPTSTLMCPWEQVGRLVAWAQAPACSPNPVLLFMTNCFVCSV